VDARPLIQALNGWWYYTQDRLGAVIRDIPKKNRPWSDLGDAFCYLLCGVMPEMGPKLTPPTVKIVTDYQIMRGPRWR
jgi:hypothetical protein